MVAAILGGTLQVLRTAIPDLQQQGALPFVVATGITAVIANIIIAVMQWFGRSPLDFLPEKTLREKDLKRFRLSESKDPRILAEQADLADKAKEYDWAVLFAEAWVKAVPGEARAYRDLAEALINLNEPHKAIEIAKQLVELQKLDFWGYQLVGKAHAHLGEWKEAVNWYKQAYNYAVPPWDVTSWGSLAQAYEALGFIDLAIQAREEELKFLSDEFRQQYAKKHLEGLKLVQLRTHHPNTNNDLISPPSATSIS